MPGLTLDIAANTKQFQAGTKDVEKALDGVADALDDAARDSDKATERVEQSFRDLARTAERESRKVADDLSRNVNRGATNAKQAMQEVKAEGLANAAETFSSFDGSATSFVSGIQGTFGGLIAGLATVSPALIPVGVAGAAAIGLVSNAIGTSEERAEAFKTRVRELTLELIETGDIGKRSFSGIVDEIKGLATETDESKTNLADLRKIAETLHRPLSEVVDAYTRGGKPLQDLIDQSEELADIEQERYQALVSQDANDIYAPLVDGGAEYTRQLETQLGLMRDQKDALDTAQQAELDYLASGVTEFEAKVGLIDAVNQAYDDAAGSTETFISKETGLFDTAAYITAMQERETALRNYQTALATADLSSEAKAFLNEQGAEAAAQMLAGYTSAAPAQKTELNRIWTEAGRENSGSYVDELATGITGATVDAPTVTFDPKKDAENYLHLVQLHLARNPVRVTVQTTAPFGRDIP